MEDSNIFDAYELSIAFKKAVQTNDYSDSLVQEFMEFERTKIVDHHASKYDLPREEHRRCVNHCVNMINGAIKQDLFYHHLGKYYGLQYDIENCYWLKNRPAELVGKTDFTSDSGFKIEFKGYDYMVKKEDIIKELNNYDAYLKKYHKCDILYVWLTKINTITMYIKRGGEWISQHIDTSNLDKMFEAYAYYKVERI